MPAPVSAPQSALMRWPPHPSALLWTPSGWDRHHCLCFLRAGLDSPPAAGPGPGPQNPPSQSGGLPLPPPPGARAHIPKTDRSRLQEHAFSSPREVWNEGQGARGGGAFPGLDRSRPLGLEGSSAPGLEMESRPGRLRGTVVFGGELRCFGGPRARTHAGVEVGAALGVHLAWMLESVCNKPGLDHPPRALLRRAGDWVSLLEPGGLWEARLEEVGARRWRASSGEQGGVHPPRAPTPLSCLCVYPEVTPPQPHMTVPQFLLGKSWLISWALQWACTPHLPGPQLLPTLTRGHVTLKAPTAPRRPASSSGSVTSVLQTFPHRDSGALSPGHSLLSQTGRLLSRSPANPPGSGSLRRGCAFSAVAAPMSGGLTKCVDSKGHCAPPMTRGEAIEKQSQQGTLVPSL